MRAAVATLKADLAVSARELGFALCRVTKADPPPHGKAFVDWLASGEAGDMAGWLGRSREKRVEPQLVLPGTNSVIVLAMNYWQGENPPREPGLPLITTGRIARY